MQRIEGRDLCGPDDLAVGSESGKRSQPAYPITNALSESLNSKIEWVKYTARGFRNRDNFKTAIYFHCGGLDLLPAT